MMAQGLAQRRPKLTYVGVHTRNGKDTLTLRLAGHETIMAGVQAAIQQKIPGAFIDWNSAHKELNVHAPVASQDMAQQLVNLVHESTHCRLSHIHFEVGTRPLFPGSDKSPHEALVTAEAVMDKKDSSNQVGEYSVGALRIKTVLGGDIICDPLYTDANVVRLMNLKEHFETPMAALLHAEGMIERLEQEYMGGVAPRGSPVKLVGMQTTHRRHNDEDFHLTSAMIRGKDEGAIDDALKALKHRYRGDIIEGARDDDGHVVQVISADAKSMSAAGMVSALHATTHCELPVSLEATTRRSSQPPYGYRPSIRMPLSGDVKEKERETMGSALATYAGALVPAQHRVAMDGGESAIVIGKSYLREEEAREVADDYRSKISEKLERGSRKIG